MTSQPGQKPFRFGWRELVTHVMNLHMDGAPPLVAGSVVDRADCRVVVDGVERPSRGDRKNERNAVSGARGESDLLQHKRPLGAVSHLEANYAMPERLPFVADDRRPRFDRWIIFLRPNTHPERVTRILVRLDVDNGSTDVAERHSHLTLALDEIQKSPLGVCENERRKIACRWMLFSRRRTQY